MQAGVLCDFSVFFTAAFKKLDTLHACTTVHPSGYTADSEEKYTLHVYTGGGGEGHTLHVHTTAFGKRYILHVLTTVGGEG